MCIKSMKHKSISFCFILLMMIQLFIVVSFGQSDISQKIDEFSSKENLSISDFKEFVQEQKHQGYNIYILDVQEGFTFPKLITDENINKVKELINNGSDVSYESLNKDTYPDLFENYDVKFLRCKDNKEFIFFIDSQMVSLSVKPADSSIEVSVDGKLPVKPSKDEILLKKGSVYSITIYKNGNEKKTEEIDLTNYEKDVYNLKIESNISFIFFVLSAVIIFVVIMFIKTKFVAKNTKETKDIVNTKETTDIIIGTNVYQIESLINYDDYKEVLNKEVLGQLKRYFDKTKRKFNLIKEKNFEILANTPDLDESFKIQITKINDQINEIDSDMNNIQEDINDIENYIKDLTEQSTENKVHSIKLIIKKSQRIYSLIEQNYIKLCEKQSEQYDIKELSTKSLIDTIYTNKMYEDIINNNAKTLATLTDYIIKKDNTINKDIATIQTSIENINESINNVYKSMNNDIHRIVSNIENNKITVENALKTIDINLFRNLNSEIKNINQKLDYIESSSSKEDNIIKESLVLELNNAIQMKLNALDELIPTLVKTTNTNNNYCDLCELYKDKLDESSLGYLNTAEYLYSENKDLGLYDYSFIYIMYSKLLEGEISKCISENYLNNTSNKSLGSMIKWLRKHKSKIWSDFINELEINEIKIIRNNSAHNKNDKNILVNITHVEKIRSFLFEKPKDKDMCWIEFILSEKIHK